MVVDFGALEVIEGEAGACVQGSPPIIQLRRRYRRCDRLGMVSTQRPLTVELPGELAEALRNYALVTNTPVNQVINAALADYLEANAADVVHAAFDKGSHLFGIEVRRGVGHDLSQATRCHVVPSGSGTTGRSRSP